ncbi:hypothetical protein C8J57DRAFT_1493923 [Mycena rebaudengoi]|nr:hypothetical protein C8J57DRAFT_1493923 [Mycena rebaudengoi]
MSTLRRHEVGVSRPAHCATVPEPVAPYFHTVHPDNLHPKSAVTEKPRKAYLRWTSFVFAMSTPVLATSSTRGLPRAGFSRFAPYASLAWRRGCRRISTGPTSRLRSPPRLAPRTSTMLPASAFSASLPRLRHIHAAAAAAMSMREGPDAGFSMYASSPNLRGAKRAHARASPAHAVASPCSKSAPPAAFRVARNAASTVTSKCGRHQRHAVLCILVGPPHLNPRLCLRPLLASHAMQQARTLRCPDPPRLTSLESAVYTHRTPPAPLPMNDNAASPHETALDPSASYVLRVSSLSLTAPPPTSVAARPPISRGCDPLHVWLLSVVLLPGSVFGARSWPFSRLRCGGLGGGGADGHAERMSLLRASVVRPWWDTVLYVYDYLYL